MDIILSPHLDDAVLSLGGLLAQKGTDALVITFFAGIPPTPLQCRWDKKCGFTDSTEAMDARIKENMEALQLLDVVDERVRNYTYLDVEYRRTQSPTSIDELALQNALEKDILELLQEFAPQPLRIFAPALGLHPDHELLRRAAVAVARTHGSPTIQFFLYQDIPYAYALLEKKYKKNPFTFFMRKNPRAWNYALLTKEIARTTPDILITPIPLSQIDLEKKLAAVALYTSQVPHLGEHLLERIEKFSAAKARSLSLAAPYCEVAYKLTK